MHDQTDAEHYLSLFVEAKYPANGKGAAAMGHP
jgi:hypothetical protein